MNVFYAIRATPSFFGVALLTLAACRTPSTGGAEDPLAQPESARLGGTVVAVAYSGFRTGQHPDRGDGAVDPSDAEVLEDLKILAEVERFRLIRLYDSGRVSANVLRLIREHRLDLKVMLGAWLDAELSNHEGCEWLEVPIEPGQLEANAKRNREELARVIRLANEYEDVVIAVNVGNEALVNWTDHLIPLEQMIAYLNQAKAAIPQPVTTADNYVVWAEKGAALMKVADFAAVHTYPAWEEKTIDEAMPYTIANLRAVRAAIPDAQLVIAEAGWATVASEFGDRAGEDQQERYYEELIAWATAMNITTFFFEAFDEDWKGNPNDPDGAEKHWGLYDLQRRPKKVLRRD